MTRQKLIHLNSNELIDGEPKAPETGNLNKGEIAVNYNNEKPSLFIETQDGSIARFCSEDELWSWGSGFEWVDLGLDSGTLWLTSNLRTSGDYSDYGFFSQWSSTKEVLAGNFPESLAESTWETLPFNDGNEEFNEDLWRYYKGIIVDGNKNLTEDNDIVYKMTYGLAKSPTKEQFEELLTLDHEFVEGFDGRYQGGYIFSGSNGNVLFLPCAGLINDGIYLGDPNENVLAYWSSTSSEESGQNGYGPAYAYCLFGDDEGISLTNSIYKKVSMAHRGVVNQDENPEMGKMGCLTEIDYTINQKQDKLIPGITIKGINEKSILGSGNIMLEEPKNKVTSITSENTDTEYPSAKAVYDALYKEGPGYEFVDLGLSSGTLWMKNNLGSNSETEYGDFYQFGATDGYGIDTQEASDNSYWETAPFNDGDTSFNQSYWNSYKSDFVDSNSLLKSIYDCVYLNTNGCATLPTKDQLDELAALDKEWDPDYNGSGVSGLILHGTNGNDLFVPSAGYYSNGGDDFGEGIGFYLWSREVNDTGRKGYVFTVGCNPQDQTDLMYECGFVDRFISCSIRGVMTGSTTTGLKAKLEEEINEKQDLLVSGVNIKTINNQSLIGSGNINITGGGSSIVDSAMSDSSTNAVENGVIKEYVDSAITYVDNKIGIPVQQETASSLQITPNIFHVWGTVSTLSITLAEPEDNTKLNEYMIQFTCPSSAPTALSFPGSIVWSETPCTMYIDGAIYPIIGAGKTYQISIVNNYGIIVEF